MLLCVHSCFQSPWWGRESWLLCFFCLPVVLWLLCGSSSRCHRFVCSLWLKCTKYQIWPHRKVGTIQARFVIWEKKAWKSGYLQYYIPSHEVIGPSVPGLRSRWRRLLWMVFTATIDMAPILEKNNLNKRKFRYSKASTYEIEFDWLSCFRVEEAWKWWLMGEWWRSESLLYYQLTHSLRRMWGKTNNQQQQNSHLRVGICHRNPGT